MRSKQNEIGKLIGELNQQFPRKKSTQHAMNRKIENETNDL